MPSPLLPTVGIQSDGGSRKQTTDMRLRAFTPNQNIAFSVKPSDNLKYAKEAADTISKYAQAIQAEKERALVNEAIGMYQEDLGAIETDYYNKKLDNAVNGFDDYQKSIKALEQKYGKVFNRGNMQGALNDKISDYALQARVNGRNHHDKEVQAKAGAELEARLDQSVDHFFTHIGSPFDKQNRAEVLGNMTALLSHKGITDPNSALYTETKQAYFDKAYYRPINAMISKDPRRALMYLEGVKDDISPMRYEELKYNAHYRLEMNAEMQARREAREAQRAYNQQLRAKTQALKIDEKTFEDYEAISLTELYTRNEELPENERLSDEKLQWLAKVDATARWQEAKNKSEFFTKQDARHVSLINEAYTLAVREGRKKQFIDDPFSTNEANETNKFLPNQALINELIEVHGNGDINKARAWVRRNIFASETSINQNIIYSLPSMTDEEVINFYGDPKNVENLGLSPASYQIMQERLTEARENLSSGKSKPFQKSVVDWIMPSFDLTAKDKTNPENASKFIVINQLAKDITTKAQINAKTNGKPLTELGIWNATQEALSEPKTLKLIQDAKEAEETINDLFDEYEESMTVNLTPNQARQILRTLVYEDFAKTGQFPGYQRIFNLAIDRDMNITGLSNDLKQEQSWTDRVYLFGDPKDKDASMANEIDLHYSLAEDEIDVTGLPSIKFLLEKEKIKQGKQRRAEEITLEELEKKKKEKAKKSGKGE